jgi:hypothetical protein
MEGRLYSWVGVSENPDLTTPSDNCIDEYL